MGNFTLFENDYIYIYSTITKEFYHNKVLYCIILCWFLIIFWKICIKIRNLFKGGQIQGLRRAVQAKARSRSKWAEATSNTRCAEATSRSVWPEMRWRRCKSWGCDVGRGRSQLRPRPTGSGGLPRDRDQERGRPDVCFIWLSDLDGLAAVGGARLELCNRRGHVHS